MPKTTEAVKVPAALRTLQLLQALGKSGSPMTAQALANRLGMPRSSTYQLLEVLEAERFVVHFPEDKRWGLGVAAFELGSAYLRHDPLERLSAPILQRLLAQLTQFDPSLAAVAQVGILDGTELLYLLKAATSEYDRTGVVTDVGVRLPAHLTASGRSLLAGLDRAQLRAIYLGGLDAPLQTRTGQGPANLRELNLLLQRERAAGYSTEIGMVTVGYASVAASARNHLNLPIAAFAVTCRTDRYTETEVAALQSRIAPLVEQAAAELTKRLGAK